MPLNSTKALFLCYLLTVALSCGAALGELNATTAPLPCGGLGSTAECLIAYQQPELELDGVSKIVTSKALKPSEPACKASNRYECTPLPNGKPDCYIYKRRC
ncbi:uncharacterized protein J3R85_019228 [Psidium guajava]|nr:uncharacterized protein J3R85_019228 [Psidium guajava]